MSRGRLIPLTVLSLLVNFAYAVANCVVGLVWQTWWFIAVGVYYAILSEIRIFNILTGSGVCLLVLLLGINLIGGRYVEMAKSKIVAANEKIADAAVSSYKKIEQAVVGGYTKVEDKFVEAYLAKDGETVEEAKARLKGEK